MTGLVPVIHAPRHSHSPLPRRGWPDQVRPRGGREGGSGQTKAGAAGARAGRRPHPIRRQSVGVGSGRLVQSAPLAREELLTIELAELKLEGFDLSLTGFGEVELAGLLDKNPGRTDPDDAPDPPAHPVTEPGEMSALPVYQEGCAPTDADGRQDHHAPRRGVDRTRKKHHI